ncbi:MAG: hypothetical protein IJ875_02940 [Solobacterium sp.]|nr:hypothetical protein [Solobacterium sp.]
MALLGMVLYGYYNAKPFGSEIMQMSIQAMGFASMIYLIGFGVIAISVLMAARPTKPNPFFMWLLILLMIFVLGIVTVMLGFLYITTNWHEKVLNVGEKKDV